MKVKYIEDYYPQIKEKFPEIPDYYIDKILKHGMRSLYALTTAGADVCIKAPKNRFVMFFGKLFTNVDLCSKYYIMKYKIKLRLQYKIKNRIWNGYYYFGLTEEDYQKYIPEKRGRIKNKITFDSLCIYKMKEEVFLFRKYKYFFKIKMEKEGNFTIMLENYSTRNIEMVAKRDKDDKIVLLNE